MYFNKKGILKRDHPPAPFKGGPASKTAKK